jgi:hypothetical protein
MLNRSNCTDENVRFPGYKRKYFILIHEVNSILGTIFSGNEVRWPQIRKKRGIKYMSAPYASFSPLLEGQKKGNKEGGFVQLMPIICSGIVLICGLISILSSGIFY